MKGRNEDQPKNSTSDSKVARGKNKHVLSETASAFVHFFFMVFSRGGGIATTCMYTYKCFETEQLTHAHRKSPTADRQKMGYLGVS